MKKGLMTLNGRLGYIRKQKNGKYMFVSKSRGRPIWKNLEPWEIKAAKPYKEKYTVLFVPSFDSVSEWGRRRLTARVGSKDKFTKKEAERVASKLRRRGDKAIRIKKLR